MKVREVDLTLMVYDFALVARSDMTSAYEANADISSYRSRYNEPKFKLSLDDQSSVRGSVSEYLLTTGLYRRAFKNFFGSVAIIMDLNFSPEPEAEELIRFVKGSDYIKYFSQTEFKLSEFRLSHSEIPILL
jgi:hypothetical protein